MQIGAGTSSDTSYYFVYEGLDPVAEYVDEGSDGSMDRTRIYWVLPDIDRRVGFVELEGGNAHYYFYLTDQVGSVLQIVDENDTVVNQYDYDAFGNLVPENTFETVENRYRFQGREYDAHAGHYYFRNRTYIPEWGVWPQPDPDIRVKDPNGCWGYVFVENSPIDRVDPLGLTDMKPRWHHLIGKDRQMVEFFTKRLGWSTKRFEDLRDSFGVIMSHADHMTSGEGTGIHPEWSPALLDKLDDALGEVGAEALNEAKIRGIASDLKTDPRFAQQFSASFDAPMPYEGKGGWRRGEYGPDKPKRQAINDALEELAEARGDPAVSAKRLAQRRRTVRRRVVQTLQLLVVVGIGMEAADALGEGVRMEYRRLCQKYNAGHLKKRELEQFAMDLAIGDPNKGIPEGGVLPQPVALALMGYITWQRTQPVERKSPPLGAILKQIITDLLE